MHQSIWKLGVDVGGTFTDGILYNSATGESYRSKVISTPENQAKAVLAAVHQLKSLVPTGTVLDLSLHHGTTVATNALLEGTGARVGLIVTQGYRDILLMKRSQVPGGELPQRNSTHARS
ncbi:DL-hydantoinase-like protein [Mycena sanguinolenta]|nr:DL-hydantoinase-like protein [Mycena sanguinolenta]